MRRRQAARPSDSTQPPVRQIPSHRNRFGGVAALLAALVALPVDSAVAQLAAANLPEHEQWIVYGGPELALYGHTGRARTSSSQLSGPRVFNPSQQRGDLGTAIVEPDRNRERILAFLIGGTFGVMTPALAVPTHPRLFFDVNVSVPMTTEVQFNRYSNPGTIAFPDGTSDTVPVGEGLIEGTGNQISAQQQGPQVHATIGPAFEIPLGPDERLRIKPGVVYSRTILDVNAVTNRAVRLNNDNGDDNGLEDYRFIMLSDDQEEVYHAVGPSLELDYDPGIEWGPIRVGLYGRVHAGYIFGDLETEMQGTNPDPAAPNETVRWKFIQDRWTYRVGTGLRIFWSPKF